ncbi:MAG: CinA family nicotinamide mononucleotide deamidase-related protein [Ferruginibacter sp.]|nr:CinA family nicotinamide mononucleotide deamidase-related protein [Ferruginibacter sp.]
MLNASIITIGDELLIGQVIDTNSAWIARSLNPMGIAIQRRVSVGDDAHQIRQALDECLACTDLVFVTGGLGPTSDDITKPLLCAYFGGKMVMNESVQAHIQHLFEHHLKRPVSPRNLQQAMVPDVCTVIPNAQGTAPGMLFKKEHKLIFSMPGVPFEMKTMMEEQVMPMLKKSFPLPPIQHRTLMVSGIPESNLADLLVPYEAQLPDGITISYLPNFGLIRLRLSADNISTELLDAQFNTLQVAVEPYLVVNEDISIVEVVARKLIAHQATLSTAESCTGGFLSHRITSFAGSSQYFKGSLVSYENDIKQRLLGVEESVLMEHGAVSEPVVRQMLQGVLQVMQTDYGIALSGIMGPGGGTPEKPVGTLWIAAGSREVQRTKCIKLRYSRQNNIEAAAVQGFHLLLETIGSTP